MTATGQGELLQPARKAGKSLIGWLSHTALEHVAGLGLTTVSEAAARLYFFNRLPLATRWWRLWPDAETVMSHLGLSAISAERLPCGLGRDRRADPAWILWRSPDATVPGRHKLYISPAPRAIADAFEAVLEEVSRSGALALKVGADAAGLLRPDKFVAYFESQDHLRSFAAGLAPALTGMETHGVPFTAPLNDQATLSWGIDPDVSFEPQFSDASWRVTLCARLAHGLLDMREDASSAERLENALLWAAKSGVDTVDWAPVTA